MLIAAVLLLHLQVEDDKGIIRTIKGQFWYILFKTRLLVTYFWMRLAFLADSSCSVTCL